MGTALHKELVGNGVLEDLQVFWPLAVRVALEADQLTDELLLVTERALQEAPPVSSLVGHAHVFRALLAERDGGSDPAEIETDLREGDADRWSGALMPRRISAAGWSRWSQPRRWADRASAATQVAA